MSGVVSSPQIFGDEEPCNSEELEKIISELNESVEKFDKEIEECQKLRRKLELKSDTGHF